MISFATAASFSSLRAASAIKAPPSASASAQARPIPWEAPVISAIRPITPGILGLSPSAKVNCKLYAIASDARGFHHTLHCVTGVTSLLPDAAYIGSSLTGKAHFSRSQNTIGIPNRALHTKLTHDPFAEVILRRPLAIIES